ncbi:MAG: hypothetical protein B0A82_18135 [Alkalinema sp. CACIAM 70d]|nr:MAG: hypothetical protein B0A82_18135 [Alkalinema sp. CACIAM 70d]
MIQDLDYQEKIELSQHQGLNTVQGGLYARSSGSTLTTSGGSFSTTSSFALGLQTSTIAYTQAVVLWPSMSLAWGTASSQASN